MIKTPNIFIIKCGCGEVGGWDSCCVAGWVLPFVFLLAIPIGVAWGQGVVAVLSAHGGPMLTDLHSFSKHRNLCRGCCLTSNVRQTLTLFSQKNVNFEL